jgi:hypothetical protein
MKKIVSILIVFYLFQNVMAQNGEIISKGVIFFKDKTTFILPDSFSILNKDGSVNAKIIRINDVIDINYNLKSENVKSIEPLKRIYPYYYLENKKYKAPIPNVIVRANYPDFGVFVMDANKISDSIYEVFVDGEWKNLVNHNFIYCNWDDFLKQLLIKLPKGIHIYSKINIKSKSYLTKSDVIYKAIEVNGDWIKVRCESKCHDCKNTKKNNGWIRWKRGDILLVDLYYVC